MNAGNIPNELSQLSNLQRLLLNNNNLSGNDFLNIIYCIVWLEQGEFLLNSRCCQSFHIFILVTIKASQVANLSLTLILQWWMWTGGPGRNLWSRDEVQDYFSSLPLTEINMSLRRNFLMFLHGCHLHDLSMFPHAAAVIGLRSVIKCMSMPYFDRAVMEFIHHTRGWSISHTKLSLLIGAFYKYYSRI